MRRRRPILRRRRNLTLLLLSLLLTTIVVSGYGPCSPSQQPKTVADTLVTLGNIKRQLKADGEITPQQDYDISVKLLQANRAYRSFISDELARLSLADSQKQP